MTSPLAFTYEGHPARVVFGDGALQKLSEEAERLALRRPVVIVSPRLAVRVARVVGLAPVATLTNAVMHVPVDVAQAAVATAVRESADGLLAVGGGSAVGLAKAIARDTGLPIVAVPTTYSGSEMTSIWGMTENGEKHTGKDPRVRRATVLYDPELTRALPPAIAGPSGLNAIAHAMEALYARDADPVTLLLAEEAVAAIAAHLPASTRPSVEETREAGRRVLYGAWLAGTCLDRTTMGIHHKLCHVLGGTFGLAHAPVHAIILPHAAAFNREAAPDAMRRLARALGTADAPFALFALARKLEVPASLSALGMRPDDIDRAVEIATRDPYANPRPVDRAGVRALLEDALYGRPPAPARTR